MYKSTNTTWSTTFPLDKASKKRYTESVRTQLNLSAFDDDEVAGSAVDYLYAPGNQSKTQSFLKNNGFPSAQEREFGKELLGVQQERKNLMDEFKSKVKTPVNTEHYGESDRAFMQGLLGDEEGEREYQKRVANVNAQNAANTRKQNELLNAFKGSQFESLLNPTASVSGVVQNQGERISALQPIQTYDASKQPENKQFPSGIKNRDYSDKGFWYVQGANDSTNGKTSNIAIQQDDKKYSKRTQEEIAIYSQIWMDAETAYDLGIINQYEKKSVQAYAHNQANEIRYRASNPFKSFFEDTIEFATFDLLLGDFSHTTVHAADLSTGAIKKMYTNPDNLSLIIATGVAKGFTGGNSRTLGSTKINGQSVRVDIEMPTGKSNGNIHVHVDGEKIFLNSVDDIQELSKGIRKSDKVVDWIKKAFQLFNKLT